MLFVTLVNDDALSTAVRKFNGSWIYFAAAALLIFFAAMSAGRKVHRNLKAKMDRYYCWHQHAYPGANLVAALGAKSQGSYAASSA